jgi:hypothetical protein
MMKHEGLQVGSFFNAHFFNGRNYCIKSNFVYRLVITHATNKP